MNRREILSVLIMAFIVGAVIGFYVLRLMLQ